MNAEYKIFHYGPISILLTMTCVTVGCINCLEVWWPHIGDWPALTHAIVLITWLGICLFNLLSAVIIGPGFLPFHWKPDNPQDERYLQYCKICKGFKAPRAHHCKRCGRCVLKMDHHCPWINNCCGHRNHANFILLLIFGIIAASHACFVLGRCTYQAVFAVNHVHSRMVTMIHMTTNVFLFSLFSIGIAIGAIIGMAVLLFVQMRLICKNQTGIESYIVSKAKKSQRNNEDVFVFPYDLGLKGNLKQFFFHVPSYGKNDGVDWPVKDGCHKYDLTIEQIRQKEEKKNASRKYTIVTDYNGSIFPISKGLRAAFTPPCFTDEPRIPVIVGDEVLVSRSKRHWFYGEIENDASAEDGNPIRGWFPRCCAKENISSEEIHPTRGAERHHKKE